MTAKDLIKILNFYARFTPSYTRIGYLARGLFLKGYKSDFAGQRWLVTGASGGHWQSDYQRLLQKAAQRCSLSHRNETKLKALMDDLPETAAIVSALRVADMSLQSETQKLADRLRRRSNRSTC